MASFYPVARAVVRRVLLPGRGYQARREVVDVFIGTFVDGGPLEGKRIVLEDDELMIQNFGEISPPILNELGHAGDVLWTNDEARTLIEDRALAAEPEH